jgi:hypothetical protein
MSPEFLAMFLEGDDTLPEPDAVLGFEDDGGEEPGKVPPVDELLQNDDVKVVVEAAKGLRPVAVDS